MTLSAQGTRNVLATSADEPLIELAEITHPELEVPIRVANNSEAIVSQGNEFIACPFSLEWPDDVDQQLPRATVSVNNVDRRITQFLEVSGGGKGSKMRIMAILPSEPDILQADMKLDLSGISINNQTVDGQLGFKNTLMRPAVSVRYDPTTAPGMW